IAEWAKSENISYNLIKIWEGDRLKADDHLVVLGGPMSAYDDLAFIYEEKEFLRRYIKGGGRVFGICLGAQLIASALGACVYPGAWREAGWGSVTWMAHPYFGKIANEEVVFHWHGDTFDLPPGIVRLARNDAYENQAFASPDGKVVGVQFHLEMTPESIEALLEADGAYLSSSSPYVQQPYEIRQGVIATQRTNLLLATLLSRWMRC
ncbi:MAG: GMP synthase, partial [Campylobacterales bacterium]